MKIIDGPFSKKIKNKTRIYYKCSCDCGIELEILKHNIKKQSTCKNCQKRKFQKLKVGDVYHKLTFIRYVEGKESIIEVLCECGKQYEISRKTWKRQKTCGCIKNIKGLGHWNYKGTKNISLNHFWSIKNNAEKRSLEFNLDINYLDSLLEKQKFKCKLSNLDISFGIKTKTASLDRIDSDIGYIENNVQWVHKDINRMKTDFQEEYFLKLCKLITENQELGK